MDYLRGAFRRAKKWAYRLWKKPFPRDWRQRIIRETGFAFPIPKHPKFHKRPVKVNKLGIRFLKRKEFPQWTAWNKDDPDSLYINTHQLAAILRQKLGVPGTDELTYILADAIGAGILKKYHPGEYQIKSLFTNDVVTKTALPTHWFHPQELKNIRDF